MLSTLMFMIQAATTPAEALATIEGQWAGALEYRDYQTDKMSKIPMSITVEAIPDGATFIQKATAADPRNPVYITYLLRVDGNKLFTTQSRVGQTVESYGDDMKYTAGKDGENWSIVFSRTGADAGRPANIRETMTRKGNDLSAVKEVDFLDDKIAKWEFRNRTVLSR